MGMEAGIARVVVAELQRLDYETYEEVSTGYAGRRADVVGLRGPVVCVVEVKVSMSLRLLDQLDAWSGQAHLVIGAVQSGRMGTAACQYCRHEGFGLWVVSGDSIREEVSPRLARRADTRRMRRHLRAEQRSGQYAAAGTNGGYYTPFRQTCQALLEVVALEPGIGLREALARTAHHYSCQKSALSSLPTLITRGVVSGVRLEHKGRRVCLYPTTTERARADSP